MNERIREIVYTPGFGQILRALEELATTKKAQMIETSATESLDKIRFRAGQISGLAMAVDFLLNEKKAADAKEQRAA